MNKAALVAAINARLEQVKATLEPLADETALTLTALFPAWAAGVAYAVDERIQYNEKLYRVVQTLSLIHI